MISIPMVHLVPRRVGIVGFVPNPSTVVITACRVGRGRLKDAELATCRTLAQAYCGACEADQISIDSSLLGETP